MTLISREEDGRGIVAGSGRRLEFGTVVTGSRYLFPVQKIRITSLGRL
jgi:hypothetical protein